MTQTQTPSSPPNLPPTMRAVRVHQFGPPEVMQLETLPVPHPGPAELLVRVHVAGINYADLGQRGAMMGGGRPPQDGPPAGPPAGPPPGGPLGSPTPGQAGPPASSGGSGPAGAPGKPPAGMRGGPHAVELPYTPGFEVVGTVVALGQGVSGFDVGQRVAAVLEHGGYAEYAVTPLEKTYAVPEGLSDPEASLMLVQGLTAYGVLHDAARIQPGEWVLIEAAAGGVGNLALQLARAAGARVVAAVGSPEKLEAVRALGADLALDYSEPGWDAQVMEATAGAGVNVVLESVGGEVARLALGVCAPFARVVLFGGASGQMLPPGAMMMGMMMQGLSFTGFNPWQRPERAPGNARAVAGALLEGQVKPLIQKFTLEAVVQAHQAIEGRRVLGKAVLQVS